MVARGEGIVKEFGMSLYTLLYLNWCATRTCCVARGTMLNAMEQAGWKVGLGANGCMYMYG